MEITVRYHSELVALIVAIFLVPAEQLSAWAQGGSADKIEIFERPSNGSAVSRNVVKILTNLDRQISPMGVRIYDYDKIETAMKDGMVFVSAIDRSKLSEPNFDYKNITSIEYGFRAALDVASFKIIRLFNLEGGEIILPK